MTTYKKNILSLCEGDFLLNILETQLRQQAHFEELINSSALHANGFIRIRLIDDRPFGEVRIHSWQPSTQKMVSDLHTHVWDFNSLVLEGSITNRVYSAVRPNDVLLAAESNKYFKYECTHMLDKNVEGGELIHTESCQLKLIREEACFPFHQYHQIHDEIHDAVPSNTRATTTILIHGEARSGQSQVYSKTKKTGNISDTTPRQASPQQVKAVLERVICKIREMQKQSKTG